MAFRRFLALALVIFAAASLLVDVLVVYEAWSLRATLSGQLASSAVLARDTLATSDQTLALLDTQLQSVATLTTSAQSAARTSATTIQNTHQSLQSASRLLRTDIPTTLSTVHQAVISAQTASALVDDVLSGLSLIPGFPAAYHPQVPLHVALGNVATSLDQLPNLTRQLADDLDAADANLPTAQTEVSGVAQSLQQSPIDANQMRVLVAQYREEVASFNLQLTALQATATQVMTLIAVAVTFLTLWLAIVQGLLLAIAWRWLRDHPA